MMDHWTTARIKDVAKLNPPTLLPKLDEVDFFPMEAIGVDGGLTHGQRKAISQAGGYSQVKIGDVCFAKVTPCFENGKSAIVEGVDSKVALATTEITVLRPNKKINCHFLHYRIKGLDFASGGANEMKGAGGLKRVPERFASDFVFHLPPLPEQLAIADYLDRQTALIDQRLTTLAEKKAVLAELRKATIHEAVTKGLNKTAPMKDTGVAWIGAIPQEWELVRVKDVSPVNRGASPRPIDDPIYFDDEGEYAWVRIADVSASLNGFLETTTQRLSKLGEAKSVKRHPGDLFLSIAGTVGKACITKIKACIHDGFVYFPRMNEEATKKFFFYLFNSGLAYDGLGKFGTQLNLNTETVGSILVPLPPLPEQSAIAGHLDYQTQQFDAQLATLDEQAQVLKELRKAIIHEAVTGKIDLAHYTPPPQQALAA